MGTYRITEIISGHPNKFSCMVSFNGNNSEFYEIEIPTDMGRTENLDENGNPILDEKGMPTFTQIAIPELTPSYCDKILQEVADNAEAIQNSSQNFNFELANGKISV